MTKGTVVSNLARYYSRTTPENPGLKKLQHAGNSRTHRDQEVLLQRRIPETGGKYPSWGGLEPVRPSIFITDQAEGPSALPVTHLGH